MATARRGKAPPQTAPVFWIRTPRTPRPPAGPGRPGRTMRRVSWTKAVAAMSAAALTLGAPWVTSAQPDGNAVGPRAFGWDDRCCNNLGNAGCPANIDDAIVDLTNTYTADEHACNRYAVRGCVVSPVPVYILPHPPVRSSPPPPSPPPLAPADLAAVRMFAAGSHISCHNFERAREGRREPFHLFGFSP